MEIVRCSKGHFYDSEENATCPMCAAEAARNKNPLGNNILEGGIIPTEYFGQTGNSHAVDNTPSPTVPVDPNGGKVQGYQPTVSAQNPFIETPPHYTGLSDHEARLPRRRRRQGGKRFL